MEKKPHNSRAHGERWSKYPWPNGCIGIAVDEPDKVVQFAEELGLNYPALIGGYGAIELSKTLGNQLSALPFTIVIDRTGAVARTQLGPFKSDKLRAIIGNLL